MSSLAHPANPDRPTPAASTASTASDPRIRRSFTLPTRPSNRPSQSASPARDNADGIETLFTHIATKIVGFSAPHATSFQSPNARRSGSKSDAETQASIPWKTSTERTLAVGPLRIYRVISSNVSFLNSGNFLHTIFPKSQCWCVDGECNFVLRIRQDSYYRIELPFETEEDKSKTEEFKSVLDKVLRYEKTPSPFAGGFEDELLEWPKSPVRRHSLRETPTRAKKWLFDKTWVPEDGPRPFRDDYGSRPSYNFEDDDRSSIIEEEPNADDPKPIQPKGPLFTLVPSLPDRAKQFQGLRSVPGPAEILARGLRWTRPEYPQCPETHDQSRERPGPSPLGGAASMMSSTDSFYSLDNTVSETPSPPYLDAKADFEENPWAGEQRFQGPEIEREEIPVRGRQRHRRHTSAATVRAPSTGLAQVVTPITPTTDAKVSSAPSTPPLISDSDDSFEPPFLDVPTPPDTIKLRKLTGASQRRAFSPMPSAQNLFLPRAHQPPRKQMTAALVRKTCELILGPPAHLVALMLRIAARIAKGDFGWGMYRKREKKKDEKVPGTWESSDEDRWEFEDDFGIPLTNLGDSTLRRRRGRSSSSGVD